MGEFMLIIKGFLIGIAKILPGISGALLAITLGVYEKAIESVSNFFKNPFKSIKYLFPLLIGICLAIVLTSKVIVYLLTNYYLFTIILFIGLMVGGVPDLFKKISFNQLKRIHYVLLISSFSLVFIISLINKQTFFTIPSVGLYFFIGSIDAVTTIVPGISGTAILMILGCYHLLLDLMSNIGSFYNNSFLISYGIGLVISSFLTSKVMNYLFKKKELAIYSVITGFMISSILILFVNCMRNINSLFDLILGFILFVIGIFISKRFS